MYAKRNIKKLPFATNPNMFFFIPRLGCHHWGARPPLRRGSHKPKNLKNQKKKKVFFF